MEKRKKQEEKKAFLEPPLDANGRVDKNGHVRVRKRTLVDNLVVRNALPPYHRLLRPLFAGAALGHHFNII
jgi:hypothetical protein